MWHSLKKDKEQYIIIVDTSITSPEIKPIDNQIFGTHQIWQYGYNETLK